MNPTDPKRLDIVSATMIDHTTSGKNPYSSYSCCLTFKIGRAIRKLVVCYTLVSH